MGTILASAITGKAQIILQDTTGIRWPLATELLGWLNDGQREVATVYPDQASVTGNLTLVTGTKQTLPAGGITLLKLMRNMGAGTMPGNAIRKVPQEILDSQVPGWHALTAVSDIRHYVYDTRAPRVFYVYPPSTAGNQVEGLYTVSPTDLTTTAQAIGIDDVWANALLDYVLYRAYNKDLEMAGDENRAKDHKAAFDNLLATKKAVDVSLKPSDMAKG